MSEWTQAQAALVFGGGIAHLVGYPSVGKLVKMIAYISGTAMTMNENGSLNSRLSSPIYLSPFAGLAASCVCRNFLNP